MLIPKQALNATKVAATGSMRYAINGALLQRDGDKCAIVATDGHMLIETRWTQDVATAVHTGGKENFSKIIEKKALVAAMKDHKPSKPQGNPPITLAEPASGGETASIATVSRNGSATHLCPAIDGNFPDYKAVIPEYKPAEAVTYAINAELLATLVTAVADSVGNPGHSQVTLTIPANEERAMRIDATYENVSSVGVLMPCKYGNPDNKALQAAADLAPAMNDISDIVSSITATSTEAEIRHALVHIGEMADNLNPDKE